jgi:uncharacterized protein (DUF1800 family)
MAQSNATIAAVRFGYGLRPGEEPPGDAAGLLAQIRAGIAEKPSFPRDGLTGRLERATRLLSVKAAEAKAAQAGKPNQNIRQEMEKEALQSFRQDAMARLGRAVHSPLGFYERLVSFWSNHFSVSVANFIPMGMIAGLHEAQAIRPKIGGRFSALLQSAVLHPAMLISVEGDDSVAGTTAGKPAAGRNERLARHLLDHYTIGPDAGQTAEDVHAVARLLSGVTVDYRALTVIFEQRLAVDGPRVVLGRNYSGDEGNNQDHVLMLDDLAVHPRTAAYICRKLVQHFVADEAPEELVTAMTDAWARSQGDLTEVYRTMLDQPRAWSEPGRKIKTPFEFVASTFRAIELSERSLSGLLRDMEIEAEGPVGKAIELAAGIKVEDRKARADRAEALTLGGLRQMGQPMWHPAAAQGFADDAATWLTAQQMRERVGWARLVAGIFAQRIEPASLVDAALGDAARPETRSLVEQAPTRLQGIAMVLVSPDFIRR